MFKNNLEDFLSLIDKVKSIPKDTLLLLLNLLDTIPTILLISSLTKSLMSLWSTLQMLPILENLIAGILKTK